MAGIKKRLRIYRQRFLWIRQAANKAGVSLIAARAEMKVAKEKYGISYDKYARENIAAIKDKDEKQKKIEEIINRQEWYVKKVAEESGRDLKTVHEEMDRIRKKYGISYYDYRANQLFMMDDKEISEWKQSRNQKRAEVISYAAQESGWSETKVRNHMAYCSANYFIRQTSYKNNRCWELDDSQLAAMARDEDSIALSAKYNKKTGKLYDKKVFNTVYKEFIGRKFWTNDEGADFEGFKLFLDGLDRIFCKPTTLSCGKGAAAVEVPESEEEQKALYDSLMAREPIIAEEFIVQHDAMSEIYPGSVNTIRLTSLMDEEGNCHHLWSFVRFGKNPGVDNFYNGGIAAAVDVETGMVITHARDSEGNVYETHPVTGKKIKGFQIPMWDETIELVNKALKKDPDINYAGWDVALRNDGPILVEGNSRSQCSAYQSLFDAKTEGKRYTYEAFL